MISLLLILLISGSYCVGDERVRFAAVLFRHGDRTPVDSYPTDPWRNESMWPVKFGELTNIGKQQHYALGQWLRKRYSHLLSTRMYPPVGSSVWNTDLLWQPMPVHTVPEKEDEILSMKKPCPAYNQEYKKVTSSKAYKERLMKYQKLMDYLTAYTGTKVKDYYDIDNIYSVLNIENLYNFTLPVFTTETSSPVLARLKVGPFIKQVMSKMRDAMEENVQSVHEKHPKVLIYSAHDLNIGSVLNALGVFDNKCPVYTATVFFELIHDNTTSEHYIRISYRNSTEIVEPHVLSIPYCGKLCPVDRFVQLYDNLVKYGVHESSAIGDTDSDSEQIS
ncbi:Acid phosphatase-1 [Operophtera brumata]|uniref:acid phosphatase n=1 Tax=Operophtera brumata TaxID=104452 RepID=A0A0L7LED2_OPEBR|nr:Acid phosphatase-1 [Operophtera brumata]